MAVSQSYPFVKFENRSVQSRQVSSSVFCAETHYKESNVDESYNVGNKAVALVEYCQAWCEYHDGSGQNKNLFHNIIYCLCHNQIMQNLPNMGHAAISF